MGYCPWQLVAAGFWTCGNHTNGKGNSKGTLP